MAEKQTNKERLKEITAKIEEGVKEVFTSGKYADYLRTMSRFTRYSVNNRLLIYSQNPRASHVAGYQAWQTKFERHVVKGAKGITIIAPTPFKKVVEEEKLNPDTKLPILDENGDVMTEEKEIKIPMFKPVTVLDVADTDGKPLPVLAETLVGDVQNYEVFMEALRRSSPVPILFEPMDAGMDGYFSLTEQNIHLREDMSEIQTVCAAVHEITHAKLHNSDAEEQKSHRVEEIEAESVAYSVCAYYGIETDANSFGYLANYTQGKSIAELKASLGLIGKTADELITDIDRHYAEIMTEQENTIESSQPDIEQPYRYYITTEALAHGSYPLQENSVVNETVAPQVYEDSITAYGYIDYPEPLTAEQIAEYKLIPAGEAKVQELLPDPLVPVDVMHNYGYTDADMLPISKDRALELVERDVTLYMLYSDNTEEIVFDRSDIEDFDGLFGITHEEWDAVKDMIPPRDVEQRFMNNPVDAMAVYQLKEDAPVELLFTGLEWLDSPPDKANYTAVYTRDLVPDDDATRILENFYYIFNDDRPVDFTGHSLSISDIIALKQDGVVSYYYCDSIGFKELPDFGKENPLRNAEMLLEDDASMYDGIINNGKHVVSDIEFIARYIIMLKKGTIIDNAPPHELTKKIEGKVWNISCAESNVQPMQEKFRVTNIARDEETGNVLLRVLSETQPTNGAKIVSLRSRTIIYTYLEILSVQHKLTIT